MQRLPRAVFARRALPRINAIRHQNGPAISLELKNEIGLVQELRATRPDAKRQPQFGARPINHEQRQHADSASGVSKCSARLQSLTSAARTKAAYEVFYQHLHMLTAIGAVRDLCFA